MYGICIPVPVYRLLANDLSLTPRKSLACFVSSSPLLGCFIFDIGYFGFDKGLLFALDVYHDLVRIGFQHMKETIVLVFEKQ